MGKPKIRFKGYTEDWEQRKCKEIFDKVGKPVNIKEGELYREIGIRSHGKGLFYKDEINGYELGNKRVFWIEPDCFIVNIVFAWERAVARTTKNEIGMIASHRFPMYKPKIKIVDLDYITKFFTTNKGKYILEMASPGGAGRNKTMGQKEFADSIISLPSYDEQKKIGRLIECLDNLITLHQRKCDETKKLKKCMLQKMFPKEGEKVPEIRFSGFTGDWKQRKLGEVFEQTTNFVNPDKGEIELWSLTVEDGLTPKSERYNREFLVKKNANFKKVRPGDIVYNPMNMTLGAVGYNGMLKNVAVSGYYITMFVKTGYDSYYINTWLKSPQAISLYKTFATGSLIEKQRVQFSTLSIIPTVFPEYEEQKRIGCYFNNLDSLITFHQRKCDELKNIKKFMLQNMFVSEK